jgi:uroporphyrinogen decarboxylase
MNNRERAMNILHYKKADRMPAVHFGYWDELLVEWAEQGHIPKELSFQVYDGSEKDRELDKLIGWDFNWFTVRAGANFGLSPRFETKVIEELPDGFLRIQNGDGLIERVKPGTSSIPAEDDYQLKDREAYEKLYLPKLQWSEDRIDRKALEWMKNQEDAKRDYPLGLHLGSVFGDIRNMLSVVGMSYLMCDDYDLLVEFVDAYANLQFKAAEEALKIYSGFDFAHYWEDICFKNGPLLSPAMFEELCAKHYKKRNELVRDYGIDIISLDCDGVTEALLPVWFENGVNTMFPIEVGTWGDQFAPARARYGKGMLGVGAMDKTAFRKDKAAVDAELARMQKLAELGGFIPCPDHRLMPGSKFELVKYYAQEIKKIKL